MRDPEVIRRLEADGVLLGVAGGVRTTPRWQGAMARAALRLQAQGAPWNPRLPIAAALLELRPDLGDEELALRIEALLPVEAAGLGAEERAGSP